MWETPPQIINVLEHVVESTLAESRLVLIESHQGETHPVEPRFFAQLPSLSYPCYRKRVQLSVTDLKVSFVPVRSEAGVNAVVLAMRIAFYSSKVGLSEEKLVKPVDNVVSEVKHCKDWSADADNVLCIMLLFIREPCRDLIHVE